MLKNKKASYIITSLILVFVIFTSNTPTVFGKETTIVSDFTKTEVPNNIISFNESDFASAIMPANAQVKKIKILSLPSEKTGQLNLYGVPITTTGQFSISSSSGLSFKPAKGFIGSANFQYVAINEGIETNTATITMELKSDSKINNSPIAADKTIVAYKNLAKQSTLSASDADGDKLSYQIVSAPKNGNVKITDKVQGEFVYTPKKNYVGNDNFSFIAKDEISESRTAFVNVNVTDKEPLADASITYYDLYEHWSEYSAVKLYEKGILTGEKIGDKYFYNPNKVITRIEFLETLIAAVGHNLKEGDTNINFADEAYCQPWMVETGKKAYAMGIISGVGTNGAVMLNPNRPITRAEAAVMLNNAASSAMNAISTLDLKFDDRYSIPNWAMQSVKNLEAYGIINGYEDNTFRPTDVITKDQCGEMIYQVIKLMEKGKLK